MYRFMLVRIMLLWDVSIIDWKRILNVLRNMLVSLLNKLLNVYSLALILVAIIIIMM